MHKFLYFTASLLLGLGTILVLSPLFLWWFIHGDYERYMWIINGPYPFSAFGGGPFQLWVGTGLLAAGFLFMILSLFVHKLIRNMK